MISRVGIDHYQDMIGLNALPELKSLEESCRPTWMPSPLKMKLDVYQELLAGDVPTKRGLTFLARLHELNHAR